MIPGGLELVAIVGLILLLFGPQLLPDSARNLGRASKEAKAGLAESKPDDQQRSE